MKITKQNKEEKKEVMGCENCSSIYIRCDVCHEDLEKNFLCFSIYGEDIRFHFCSRKHLNSFLDDFVVNSKKVNVDECLEKGDNRWII